MAERVRTGGGKPEARRRRRRRIRKVGVSRPTRRRAPTKKTKRGTGYPGPRKR